MKRFLPLLIVVFNCSPNSEFSNKENFKIWLEGNFNEAMLKGNYMGGDGN